jgi:hypothetical protein
MAAAYEDNFGFWTIDGPEEQAFFEHVQRQSVPTICERCERPVRLIPPKRICGFCLCAIEYGAPASIGGYRRAGPKTFEPRPPRRRRVAAKSANR